MKAKDFTLRVVNEIDEGKFEIKEFKPYMSYESFIGCILGDAEILRPTGLNDKNGKEICEGDIVSDGDFNYEVYQHNSGQWKAGQFSLWEYISDDETENCWEIVGNIYQDPNLLK